MRLQFGYASQMIYTNFDIILEIVMLLTALVECRSLNSNYHECLDSICDTTLSVSLLPLSVCLSVCLSVSLLPAHVFEMFDCLLSPF